MSKLELRQYQTEIVAAVRSAWEKYQRVLVSAATGCGKTETFMKIIEDELAKGQRVMVLVDQKDLVDQTARRIADKLGVQVGVEMAGEYVRETLMSAPPVVVSTFQSQGSQTPPRYERFNPLDFSTLIVDEAHRCITKGRMEVMEYYTKGNPALRVAGFTATPDRADGRAMGRFFQHVAYEYQILDAIGEGYLVPVIGKTVIVKSLDLSEIPANTKDFTANEIGNMMERDGPLYETVQAVLDKNEGRPTIIYTARVAHAELVAAALNKERPGKAAVVHGGTPRDQRKQILSEFESGHLEYLCNCDVLTTGIDLPLTSCIVIARPTKSRARFAQSVGRGTRVLPGVIDGLDTAAERVAAIEASAKPNCLVLSLVGKEGGIDLVGPADALAGTLDDFEEEAAREILETGETMDISEVIDKAKDRAAERREQEHVERVLFQRSSGAETQTRDIDLFNRGAVDLSGGIKAGSGLPQGTLQVLRSARVPDNVITKLGLNPKEGGRLAREIIRRRKAGFCTYRQGTALLRMGYSKTDVKTMMFETASQIIGERKGNG